MPYSSFHLDHVVGSPVFGKKLTKILLDVLKSWDYLTTEKHYYFCRSVKMSNRIICHYCIYVLILTINLLPLLYFSFPTCICDLAHS